MKLKTLTIEGFRGFNEQQTFSLDNDIVLFFGLNGSGKSTITESLEWLLFDRTSREVLANSKQEYSGTHLKNIHYSGTQPFVRLEACYNSQNYIFEKRFINARTSKLFLNDNEVEDFSSVGLPLSSSCKPILGQIESRSIIDCTRSERWNLFVSMLGLNQINSFQATLKEAKKSLMKDFDYIKKKEFVEKSINTLKEEFGQDNSSVIESKDNLCSFICEDLSIKKNLMNEELVAEIKIIIGSLEHELKIPSSILKLQPIKIEERLQEGLLKAEITKLKQAIKGFSEPAIDFNILSFKSKGVEILELQKNQQICPFCEEETFTSTKIEYINKQIQENDKALKSLKTLEEKIKSFEGVINIIITIFKGIIINLELFQGALKELKSNKKFINEYILLNSALETFLKADLPSQLEKINIELNNIKEIITSLGDIKNFGKINDIEHNYTKINTFNDLIIKTCVEFNNKIEQIKESAKNTAPGLTDKQKAYLNKLKFYGSILANYNYFSYILTYETVLNKMEALDKASNDFEKEKVISSITTLSNDIKHFYEILNPGEEIKFEKMFVDIEKKSSNIEVKGISYENKEINPISCFSEAHCNSLALSIFFSQKVKHNPEWNVILLDDPVQSLDFQHADALVNLLRDETDNKQVIVLTHHESFAEKFATQFDNALYYRFENHSIEGPEIIINKGPFGLIMHYFKELARGNSVTKKASGNILRSAMEVLLKEYQIHHQNKSYSQVKKKPLNELLLNYFRANQGSQNNGTLQRIKDDLDNLSHGAGGLSIPTNTLITHGNDLIRIWNQHFPDKVVNTL